MDKQDSQDVLMASCAIHRALHCKKATFPGFLLLFILYILSIRVSDLS